MTDPAGVIQVCNQALARIGVAQVITSLADRTPSAAQCNLWYAQCRDALLRDFPWPWATTYAQLTLVSSTTQPVNQEWTYSYRYPPDCLFIRRLLPSPTVTTGSPPLLSIPQVLMPTTISLRQDSDPYPIEYEVGRDTDGRLIYTDEPTCWIKYSLAVTDPTQFAPDFADLLAWRLAVELAYSLAISDARRTAAKQMYDETLTRTRANALNEQQRDTPFTTWNSEFIRGRYNSWPGM